MLTVWRLYPSVFTLAMLWPVVASICWILTSDFAPTFNKSVMGHYLCHVVSEPVSEPVSDPAVRCLRSRLQRRNPAPSITGARSGPRGRGHRCATDQATIAGQT